VHRNKFLYNKTNRRTDVPNLFWLKNYPFIIKKKILLHFYVKDKIFRKISFPQAFFLGGGELLQWKSIWTTGECTTNNATHYVAHMWRVSSFYVDINWFVSLIVDILNKRTGLVALAFARPLLPVETSEGSFRKMLQNKGWALVFDWTNCAGSTPYERQSAGDVQHHRIRSCSCIDRIFNNFINVFSILRRFRFENLQI
jgi:hypothetical protein